MQGKVISIWQIYILPHSIFMYTSNFKNTPLLLCLSVTKSSNDRQRFPEFFTDVVKSSSTLKVPESDYTWRPNKMYFFMMAECRMHIAGSQEGSSSVFIFIKTQHAMCVMSCTSEWCRKATTQSQSSLRKHSRRYCSLSHSGIHMGESHTIGFSYTFAGCRHMKVNAKYELQISLRSDTFPLPLPSVIKVIIWFLIQDSEVCLIHHQLLPQLRNHFNLFLFQPFNCFTLTKITNLVGSRSFPGI